MFRPCIDLHQGRVKQVVGSTFTDGDNSVVTNFVADEDAAWFARMFKLDGLGGGHVIRLGPGNDEQASGALAAYPGGLQLGGGVTAANAAEWLDRGASHVIVTSWLFPEARLDRDNLDRLVAVTGPERLVIDLSCRRIDDRYVVFTDRWTEPTDVALGSDLFAELGERCAEFLVHAVDVEGKQSGIDLELVGLLDRWSVRPVTYAGGARTIDDLAAVTDATGGRVHLTIGSALDIFGGDGVRYRDAVAYNAEILSSRHPTSPA